MKEPTHNQHITSKFRFRYWDTDRVHHEWSKRERYLGSYGVGNGIAVKQDLYEPVAEEYAQGAVETDLFANKVEPWQKTLIDSICKMVEARNVINYQGVIEGVPVLPVGWNDYHALLAFVSMCLMRQESVVHSMNERGVNKLGMYSFLNQYADDTFCVVSIAWSDLNNEFILPDVGIMRGIDGTGIASIFVPIAPHICIEHTSHGIARYRWGGDERNPVLLKHVDEEYVRWVNRQAILQCERKFVSYSRDYKS